MTVELWVSEGRITYGFAFCSPPLYALRIVGVRACVVSFAGERGVRHSVEVTAETLYEAAAQALAIFKASEWADAIGPGTELIVAVKNPETKQTVTPSQVRRWCDGVAVSPDEVLKRHRVKTFLG
jgi:hypothetical protein